MTPKTLPGAQLFSSVWEPLNLWKAFKSAAKGKRSTPAEAAFEFNLEEELIQLEDELRSGTYQPLGYHNFLIQRPKRRLISAAPFRDRVVHHALMNVIEPFFERQFIFDSYANRVGKGTHRALERCTYFLRRYDYVMHLDVVQFFQSIDHEILLCILKRNLKDDSIMDLIGKILDSGKGLNPEEQEVVYFPGDDLFAANRPTGLPIGNLTSQHWANVYLNELDQYAKRQLKCRAYLRYVDDILLFANHKQVLNDWKHAIIQFLKSLRLVLHEKSAQAQPRHLGMPFLGFIVFPDHRRLKRHNGLAFQRRLMSMAVCKRAGELSDSDLQARLIGWINHAKYGDTWGLRRKILNSAGLGIY